MTDYNALKVPDLKAMLGKRKLLQTGNKQALITRLQEDDEKNASETANDVKPDAKEDEITYSDDEATAPKPVAEESAASPAVEPKSEEPPSKPHEDAAPKAGDDQAAEAKEEAEITKPEEPAPSFAMGLASTAAAEEAKKRAERAKRFGIEEDAEAAQRAERAKRFGLDQTELASGLDSALPERPLKRGRGRGAENDGNRSGGKRPSSDRRGPHGRGPRQDTNRDRGDDGLDAAERAKAEKRAARFATS